MLANGTRRSFWSEIARAWRLLFAPARPVAQPRIPAYTGGVPRRYPIPASRAHLYARAADENC